MRIKFTATAAALALFATSVAAEAAASLDCNSSGGRTRAAGSTAVERPDGAQFSFDADVTPR